MKVNIKHILKVGIMGRILMIQSISLHMTVVAYFFLTLTNILMNLNILEPDDY